jgi:hypothetical protein
MDTDADKKPRRAQSWLGLVIVLVIGVCVLTHSDSTPLHIRIVNWMPQSKGPLTEQEIAAIRKIADPLTPKNIRYVERDEDGTVIVIAGESIGSHLHFRKFFFRWVLVQEGSWVE